MIERGEKMNILDVFIDAIKTKSIINVTIDTYEKGTVNRSCIPFDYGPSRKFKDGNDRYHFFTLNSPDGNHVLSVLPSQVLSMEITNEKFNPGDYITWEPKWIYPRDWGEYS